MSFAGRCGIEIILESLTPTSHISDIISTLFNEELGTVFQVRKQHENAFKACFATCGPPPGLLHKIGRVSTKSSSPEHRNLPWLQTHFPLSALHSPTNLVQHILPTCNASAIILSALTPNTLPSSQTQTRAFHTTSHSNPSNQSSATRCHYSPFSPLISAKPRVAILCDQGTNGHAEMAFAFHSAGFAAIDVHMTDILSYRVSLSTFCRHGCMWRLQLRRCPGGAGQGWAKSVLLHPETRTEFKAFFERKEHLYVGRVQWLVNS
jgi:phosphoribosylformylglycinamidine synthase